MEFTIKNKNKDAPSSLTKSDIIAYYAQIFIVSSPANILLLLGVLYPILSSIFNINNFGFILLASILWECFWVIILPSIIIYVLRHIFYNQLYDTKESINKKIHNTLNKVYIDKNDNEKIYLLHELIKKHGLNYSDYNQHDEFNIILNLNIDDNEYKKINYDDYNVHQIDAIKKVINNKKIDIDEASQFYDKYIEIYLSPKVMSIEESNEISQRIFNKNL